MKVDSRPGPVGFRPIDITIRIESRDEMEALRQLCENSPDCYVQGHLRKTVRNFLDDLKPHVTPA